MIAKEEEKMDRKGEEGEAGDENDLEIEVEEGGNMRGRRYKGGRRKIEMREEEGEEREDEARRGWRG